MLRAAVLLALVAVAIGAPRALSDIGEWTRHPSCHYNLSQQANYRMPNGLFHWYYDSVSSCKPQPNVTCMDWNGNYTRINGNVGTVQFSEKFVESGIGGVSTCNGTNSANANADFATECVNELADHKFNLQMRVVDTDYRSYALVTFCVGPNRQGHNEELMGILGPEKSGIEQALRVRLTERLVQAGWLPSWIQRIHSHEDC